MNRERRQQLKNLMEYIGALVDEVQSVCDAEQDRFDNLPEGLQAAPKVERMEVGVTAIETAIEALEEAQQALEEAAA